MNGEIENVISAIWSKDHQVVIVSGNIYDFVQFGSENQFPDLTSFFKEAGKEAFPHCLTYDLFSGVAIYRGDEQKIYQAAGLKNDGKDDENTQLLRALQGRRPANNSLFPAGPVEVFASFDHLLANATERTIILIEYAETVFCRDHYSPSNSSLAKLLNIALIKWARNGLIKEKGHLVVLLAKDVSGLDPLINDRCFNIKQIRIPKPDYETRIAWLKKSGGQSGSFSSVGQITAGLSLKELGRIMKKPVGSWPEVRDLVFATKKEILEEENGDILEVMKTQNGFSAIGGLVKPIRELRKIAEHMLAGRYSAVPQGILLVGPPGTGKTILAEAFAQAAGLNFIRPLDIKNMLVGESEKRMTRLLNAAIDQVPVGIFLDEIDQGQGRRDDFNGDSGVSRSLFKKLLTIMSDTSLRGKLLWIGASNRPDLLDPALKRPGRFDLIIPLLPEPESLAAVCLAAFRQYRDMEHDIKDWQPYTQHCLSYTGAAMVEVVRRAWKQACDRNQPRIEPEDMEWAIKDFRPRLLDRYQNAWMTLLAIAECSSNDLLPDNYQEIVKNCQEILNNMAGERTGKEKDIKFLHIPKTFSVN